MTPKKKPGGKPKISYRDLMAGSEKAPAEEAKVPPATAGKGRTTGDTEVTEATGKGKKRRTDGGKKGGKSRTAKVAEGAEASLHAEDASSRGVRAPLGRDVPKAAKERTTSVAPQDPEGTAAGGARHPAPATSAKSSAPSAPSAVQAVAVDSSVSSVVHSPEAVGAELPTGPRELPPNRRRDRSRELTPRELAAVLNAEQMAAAKAKAEQAAAEAEAEAAAAAQHPYVPMEALNAPIIEEIAPHRLSSSISSDTLEFAVAAATATLPFRDRVRARAGAVEVLRFRIGREFFATDLAAAEEALERPDVHGVPEMPDQMLGVFSLRGKLVPVFSPTRLLGAALSGDFSAAVVLRAGERRIALAIDDVEDVMTIDLARVRDIPTGGDPEGILLAVAWHGSDLVSLIDAEALLAACQTEQLAEMA